MYVGGMWERFIWGMWERFKAMARGNILGIWKGQFLVKLGQIRSNFKISKFSFQNMPILSSFVSGLKKCHLFL